jgi:phospholipase C
VRDTYTGEVFNKMLAPRKALDCDCSLDDSHGWYDLIVQIEGNNTFEYRLAGHVETGRDSFSDPALGGVVVKD